MKWMQILTYMPYAFFALACLVFLRPMKARIRTKAIWAMVLLACASKFVCFRELGGHPFVPRISEHLIWLWDWAYSGFIILCGLATVLYFVRFRGKERLLPIAAWGLSAWGLWNGVSVPAVRQLELAFEDLPASLDGYRIVQLADIHCSSAARRWRTQAIVDIVNAQKADLICLTGDNVDGHFADSHEFIAPLADLRAKDGIYACTGNHEYYYGYWGWRNKFYDRTTNICFLCNACAFPHEGLAVAGVPDVAGIKRHLDVAPDVQAAFASATNGEFRLLLRHQPRWADEAAREAKVDLQLSGHTHGGIAPGLNLLVARHNAGYTRGIYRHGKLTLYVNPGCGQWAGFPMRFFNPSEVTVIVLRKR